MNTSFTVLSFLNLAVIITGFILASILWFTGRKLNKVLSAAMFFLMWSVLLYFLLETKLILNVPHLYRTGHLATLLAFPLFFFYVRALASKHSFKKTDLIHFIPPLFFLVDFLLFFFQNSDAKLLLLQRDISNLSTINDFDEGWITPAHFHYVLRHVIFLFYFILESKIIYEKFYKVPDGNRNHHRTKVWLSIFVGVQLIGFLPLLISTDNEADQWRVAILSSSAPVIILTTWLFFKPEILYGSFMLEHNGTSDGHHVYTDRKRPAHLPTTDEQMMFDKVHNHMTVTRKFLQHRYTINNLASELHMPPHQLSIFLNQHHHISFNDFVNRYRVEYSIERIHNGDAKVLTLEALSAECGFNNRNSFTAAFKRVTGITPSQYMRQVENNRGN